MTTQQATRSRSRMHGSEYVRMDLYERDRDEASQDMQDIKLSLADIRKSLEGIVPRSEHSRVWADNDSHFMRIENRITDLENRVNSANQRVDNRFLSNSNQTTYLLFTLVIGVVCAVIGHLVH